MTSEEIDDLEELAKLLHQRNEIEDRISRIIVRPALNSHIGEYLASKLFNIKLEDSNLKISYQKQLLLRRIY
jgi:hypothetical protein